MTIPELIQFATGYLKVDYLFLVYTGACPIPRS